MGVDISIGTIFDPNAPPLTPQNGSRTNLMGVIWQLLGNNYALGFDRLTFPRPTSLLTLLQMDQNCNWIPIREWTLENLFGASAALVPQFVDFSWEDQAYLRKQSNES